MPKRFTKKTLDWQHFATKENFICKKDFGGNFQHIILFKKGKCYTAVKKMVSNLNDVIYGIQGEYPDTFNFIEDPTNYSDGRYSHLHDYFYSIEEWREIQLNKILHV